MSSSIENIEKVLGAKRFGDRSAQIDWILLLYQIHSKGVGHHENYNYRKKYRTDRGIKGSGRGEAFQTGEVFRTGYRCICYIKRGEAAPEGFFQAEDGIRDKLVTGVQTCALPILLHLHR